MASTLLRSNVEQGVAMRRIVGWMFLICVAIGLSVMVAWVGIVVAAAVVIAGGWQALRCHHPGPLGLLPSVIDQKGERLPTRWYCDACGQSWTASIERGRPPVQRFVGHDESKAMRAAERARDLDTGQRKLAVQRSGVSATPRLVKRADPFAQSRSRAS